MPLNNNVGISCSCCQDSQQGDTLHSSQKYANYPRNLADSVIIIIFVAPNREHLLCNQTEKKEQYK